MQPHARPVSPRSREIARRRSFGSWKAVVFDHDGTLIDTEWAEFHAVRRIWERHGATLTAERWSSVIGGVDDGDWWYRELEPLVGVRLDVDEVLAERRVHSAELLAGMDARPGIRPLLASLTDAGLPIAVASNAPVWWVERRMSTIGLLNRFAAVVGRDVVAAPKPDPAPFTTACARLGVEPHEVIAFEDSAIGVASAVAAGCFTIACPCELTTGHDLSAAHIRIESYAEVTVDWLAECHASWSST